MALTEIEYGSLASSDVMNNNFEYLDNKIAEVVQKSDSNTSAIYSNIATLNGTFSAQTEQIINEISELKIYAEKIREDLDSKDDAPDYSKGIGISLPYSVTQDGYIYAGVNGIDSFRYVYVNSKPVHGHCGYSGGKSVYSGSIFRVSAGDYITCNLTMGNYYFYPKKGEA